MKMERGSERIVVDGRVDAADGEVRWAPAKSIWIGSLSIIAVIAGPHTFSVEAFAVFLFLTAITLCAGHSVGMHRRLIHKSFSCPKWFEYFLVYLGVLVGMAGPLGMTWQHDLRDWAQRQKSCHGFLCHRQNIVKDYWWQLHCDLALRNCPRFVPEKSLGNDRVYNWMERTWMLQQAPIAIVLYSSGGWGFVVWGVAVRVVVGVTGHWLVGHFAHHEYRHTNEDMSWCVDGASVQGRDVKIAGLISMGESWHNNHHAYPGSAKIGLLPGQPDPGWWVIQFLEKVGLASDIKTPESLPYRPTLRRLDTEGTGWSVCKFRKRVWEKAFGHA